MRKLLFLILLLKISPISAQTGDFYDFGIREIRLIFSEKNWDKKLDSIRRANPPGRLACTALIDGQRFEECGIRYKGNSSYKRTKRQGYKKLPFNLKLDFRRDGQALPGGYTTLKLANVTGDPSFVREPLSYEIARTYMPAPRANFVRLYVNDQFWGLYTNVESLDDHFLKVNFGYSHGPLIKCDPELDEKPLVTKSCPKLEAADRKAYLTVFSEDTTCFSAIYELESKHGWLQFHRLLNALNKQPEKIESVLNVDQTLWMHALNNVLVNLDSYSGLLCHNYYMWQDSQARWQPFLWDLNLSFGGFRRLEVPSMTDQAMQTMLPLLHEKTANRPLISQLLKNPLYKKIYLAHLKTILNDWFANGKYLTRATEMQALIETWVKNDEAKLFDYEGFKANLTRTVTAVRDKEKEEVIGLEQLMKARTEFLLNHPDLTKTPPKISELQHVERGEFVYFSARIENANRAAWIYCRPGKQGFFQKIAFHDDGQDGDGERNDQMYFAKIERSKIGDYYILAENEESVSLLPERAGFELMHLN